MGREFYLSLPMAGHYLALGMTSQASARFIPSFSFSPVDGHCIGKFNGKMASLENIISRTVHLLRNKGDL